MCEPRNTIQYNKYIIQNTSSVRVHKVCFYAEEQSSHLEKSALAAQQYYFGKILPIIHLGSCLSFFISHFSNPSRVFSENAAFVNTVWLLNIKCETGASLAHWHHCGITMALCCCCQSEQSKEGVRLPSDSIHTTKATCCACQRLERGVREDKKRWTWGKGVTTTDIKGDTTWPPPPLFERRILNISPFVSASNIYRRKYPNIWHTVQLTNAFMFCPLFLPPLYLVLHVLEPRRKNLIFKKQNLATCNPTWKSSTRQIRKQIRKSWRHHFLKSVSDIEWIIGCAYRRITKGLLSRLRTRDLTSFGRQCKQQTSSTHMRVFTECLTEPHSYNTPQKRICRVPLLHL